MYTIDKNIELPKQGPKGQISKVVTAMELGDSIGLQTLSETNSFLTTARRNDKKLTSRKLEDGTYRVWRVE